MPISLTRLRADLYNIVDRVIETGLPVEIERNGKTIRITVLEVKSKLANLKAHHGTIVGDPDDLIHMDWSHEWKENSL